MMTEQLVELERLRSEINRLIENPTTRPLDRVDLAERLDRVAELRAEWERLRKEEVPYG
jgi:hypothetical protein